MFFRTSLVIMKRIFALFWILLVLCTACSPQSSAKEEKTGGEVEFSEEETFLEVEAPLEMPVAETPPEETSDAKKYVRSKTDGLNVRSAPSTSSSSLGQLDKGDMVAYYGVADGWYQTKYRGKDAYVSSSVRYTDLVEMGTENDLIETVIEVGESYLGTEYVYGAVRYLSAGKKQSGFTATEFDCSSYMQYIFYRGAGVILNETTRTQVKQGEHVEKDDIRRGDLLFMTNASRKNRTGIERVGHVALYLGDNYILHTASDHAVIEQMSATRWNNFIEARRMVAL